MWAPDDLPLAVSLWGEPEVARFLQADGPPSRASIEERLGRELASQAQHGFQYWPIFLRADGAFAGCCGLRPYRLEDRVHELGVHLRSAFWRRGLAVEAARAVIDHAARVLGARALFAGHHPSNVASRATLLKLGFRYTHDELYAPTGLRHPSYLLTLPGPPP